jgi:hypothetical protein
MMKDLLTQQELDTIKLMAKGMTEVSIAEILGISTNGVRKRVDKAYYKLNIPLRDKRFNPFSVLIALYVQEHPEDPIYLPNYESKTQTRKRPGCADTVRRAKDVHLAQSA